MKDEAVLIMQEDWDYLILLDACRYDYFAEVWKKFLGGNLEKKISPDTRTPEWRSKSFPESYPDVVYVSANPFINSIRPVMGFDGKRHFYAVYDLWLEYWDKKLGTVLPEVVTDKAIEIINKNPNKKAVIHYMQPHEPYLGAGISAPGYKPPDGTGTWSLIGVDNPKNAFRLRNFIVKLCSGISFRLGMKGNFIQWKLRELLKMPPATPMDAVRRKYGRNGLQEAYRENLEIVLRQVARLVESLSGRIIVTSDHGEMLGENYRYCHWARSSCRLLREIPWLVIDKGDKTVWAEQTKAEQKKEIPQDAEKQKQVEAELADRLKALGY